MKDQLILSSKCESNLYDTHIVTLITNLFVDNANKLMKGLYRRKKYIINLSFLSHYISYIIYTSSSEGIYISVCLEMNSLLCLVKQ